MTTAPQRKGHRYRMLRRRVIFEESHCCICGHEVDKTLAYPHPLSPSLEHLDKLADGGSLLNRDRCALAHLRCNTTDGARWAQARKRAPIPRRNSRAW